MISPVDFLRDIHPNPDEFICVSCIYPTDRLDIIPVENQKRVLLPVSVSDSGKFVFRPHPLYIPINIWIHRKDLVRKLRLLHALNEKHWGIYYSTAGFGEKLNESGNPSRARDNVRRIQVLFADFDFPTEASRAFEAGEAFDLLPQPNYIVRTSENKLQAIWLVTRPMNFETAGAALLYISTKTGGDAAVKDLARVLRLPGFKNTKLKSGDWPVVAEKRHDKKLEASLVEALASAGKGIRTSPSSSTVKERPARPSSLHSSRGVFFKPASASLTLAEIGPVPVGRALKQWEKIYEEKKNKTLADWGLCCYLRAIGASEKTMLTLMRRAHRDDNGMKGNDLYYRDTIRHCLEEDREQ